MNHKPLRKIASVRLKREAFIICLAVSIFTGLCLAVFTFIVGGLLLGLMRERSSSLHRGAACVSFAVVAPLIFVWLWSKEREPTHYSIFHDRVESCCGDIRLIVRFDKVRDVQVSSSFLGRPHELGTVILVTDPLFAGEEWRCLHCPGPIHHIPQPDEVHSLIQSVVAKATGEALAKSEGDAGVRNGFREQS